MHAEPVKNLLKNSTLLKAHEYDICTNTCMLFDISKNETKCSICGDERYVSDEGDSSLVPVETMKMMSVGDQLSHMLSNDDTRKMLQYRHDREEVPGTISDYFDGEDYKALKAKGMFESSDDIALALFVDGFVNQKKSQQEMIIMHVLVLNFDPSIRYECKAKITSSLLNCLYADILTTICSSLQSFQAKPKTLTLFYCQ